MQGHTIQSNPSSVPNLQRDSLHNIEKIFVVVEPVSKLYTDDMGRFPILSRSGHRYIILPLHCKSNAILIEPFQSHHDCHRIAAYIRIMTRLRERGHAVHLQVLDKKTSKEYHQVITQTWKDTFQLVTLDVHRRNAAERSIRNFKAHFSPFYQASTVLSLSPYGTCSCPRQNSP